MAIRAQKKYAIILSLAALVTVAGVSVPDRYFEVSRNLDVFNTLFRQVNRVYVDSVDAAKLMQEGIDAMLVTLDPYTQYIPESKADDFRFVTTGTYGGIGATIRIKGDYVCIGEPYEGFPAQRGGLRAGDLIVALDGQSMKGKKTDELSRLLKGKPGTTLKLLIRRQGQEADMELVLTREEVRVKNVPYAGIVQGDIGYIRLSGFTEKAAQETREALRALKKDTLLAGLILDLRGNPGGLLTEAVNVSNLFVGRGHDIVSTKGKLEEWNKTYKAINAAEDDSLPLVILVNGSSASASEIVAGSLQDFDRAVLLGQRTFGKGLVQTTRVLSYNAQVKITTSRYYIPSGRCIQAINYNQRDAGGTAMRIPDSLRKAFATQHGRTVYDGGGLLPDVATVPPEAAAPVAALLGRNMVFDYATLYRESHPTIASAGVFHLDEAVFADFMNFVDSQEITLSAGVEKELENFRKAATDEKYFSRLAPEYEALKTKLQGDRKAAMERYRKEIMQKLEEEIVSRYYYQQGRIVAALPADADVIRAAELLHSATELKAMLQGPLKPAEATREQAPAGK